MWFPLFTLLALLITVLPRGDEEMVHRKALIIEEAPLCVG
jgi:hypothetical protein